MLGYWLLPLPTIDPIVVARSGAALLALAADQLPPPEQLAELRGALRGVLQVHLGPQKLKSWGLLSELARLGQD